MPKDPGAPPPARGAVGAAGLLDELRLLRQPVVLGGGLPLFGAGTDPARYRLEATKTLTTGAVLEGYAPVRDP